MSEQEATEPFFWGNHCLMDQCCRLGRTFRGPFSLTDPCVTSIWAYKTSQLMLWLGVPNQRCLSLGCQSPHSLFFIVSNTPLIQFKISLIRLRLMPGEDPFPLLGLLILSSFLTTFTHQVGYLYDLKAISSCSSPCMYLTLLGSACFCKKKKKIHVLSITKQFFNSKKNNPSNLNLA